MLTLRGRQLREDSLPMLLPERTFVETFRLGKDNFRALCEDLITLLHPSERPTAIKPDIKILAALEFYASGSYQKSRGNDFSLALSQMTMSDCLAEVTDALNQPHILRRNISLSHDQQMNAVQLQEDYYCRGKSTAQLQSLNYLKLSL